MNQPRSRLLLITSALATLLVSTTARAAPTVTVTNPTGLALAMALRRRLSRER